MGFFYSPMKLIELIKNKGSIIEDKEKHDVDWYFSKDGKKAYDDAKTPAQKTMYFFEYLFEEVIDSPHKVDAAYRLAYVLANSVASSSLEFAGYPDILDVTKNPLINCIHTTKLSRKEIVKEGIGLMLGLDREASVLSKDTSKYVDLDDSVYIRLTYCVLLLAALNNENEVEKYLDSSTRDTLYNCLSQCGVDGSFTDKYRIERDIIGAFCSDIDIKYVPPYFRPSSVK